MGRFATCAGPTVLVRLVHMHVRVGCMTTHLNEEKKTKQKKSGRLLEHLLGGFSRIGMKGLLVFFFFFSFFQLGGILGGEGVKHL